MEQTARIRAFPTAIVVAMVLSLLAVAPAGPAAADHARVTAAEGLAFNYYTDVSLFGGPSTRLGYGQGEEGPATAASPSAECPDGGGTDSATKPEGAIAQYGPAVIFGGIWPEDAPSAPPSGPLTAAVDCALGEDGAVTASTTVTLQPAGAGYPGGVGPGPFIAEEVHSSCTMTAAGVTSDVTIVEGILETAYDPETQEPTATEPVPQNPDPNYTREGTIDHVGDSYEVVFNEQIAHPDGSFTVNAAHLFMLGPFAVGEVVIGSSTCGPITTEQIAHGAIAGTVTDADGGTPIAGATVTADGQSATTDANGDYTIPGLDPGTYTVTADADGYDQDSQTVTVAEAATATADFALDATDPGVGEACPPGEVDTAEFTDRDAIPAVHRDTIDCAAFHDIVEGFADGSFGPTLPVRRDQMAAFIARTLDAAGVDLPAATTDRFTDVAPGSTHDQAIHRLAAAGIVQGGPEGLPATSYGPGRQVRRDQMASFLIRAAEFATDQQLASQDPAFADVPPANTHFANVNAAAELGLAQGFTDGTYRPASTVRRDQMTTFVIRLLAHLVEG